MYCDLETSLPEWILDHPEVQAVFDRLGLDTSCGGKSLEYVCERNGLNAASVLQHLRQVIEACKPNEKSRKEPSMPDHIYKKIEIVGTSSNSIEEAITNAISHASKTVRDLRWFEVLETRGDIADGKVAHWQVTLKIGFTLER